MNIEEYMMLLGEDAREEDIAFIQELIDKQNSTKRTIAELIVLFWATKSHKNKLFTDIGKEIVKLSDNSRGSISDFLNTAYLNSFYHSSYALQTQLNKLHNVGVPKMPDMKWHIGGYSYLEDMQYYHNRLQYDIEKAINKNLILNGTATTVTKDIEKPFKTLHNSTNAMVDTECTYVERQAVATACDNEEVKKYMFVATLDTLTCEVCGELDGTVFTYKEAETGVNFPPIHPHCRCVAVPYFDDSETGTRAGRDGNGDTVQLPATMKFTEWNDKYGKNKGAK